MRLVSRLRFPLLALLLAGPLLADGPQLLARRCLACHNSANRLGNLSLSTRAEAERVLPARLWQRVERGEMPPGGGLAPAERTELKAWLDAGAAWPATLVPPSRPRAGQDWWSLQPLRPAQPGATIDGYLSAKLAEKGLHFSPPASRAALLRRLTFDLTGLPPTPKELAAFAKDQDPQAYAKQVDRLLASPAYGERWGRHWLDVIRFGETHGYEQNHVRPHAWRFRDYVISAFQKDLPFNRFLQEQLAGDLLAPDDPSVAVATGFLVAGPHDTVGNANLAASRQQRADDLDDMVNATASAFLGLTVNCARCHDHKFDPIQQADYYRLAAIFAGVRHADREVATPAQRAARQAAAAPLEEQRKALRAQLDALRTQAAPNLPAAETRTRAALREPVSPFGTQESFPPQPLRYLRLSAPQGFPGGLDEVELFTTQSQEATPTNVARQAQVVVSSTRIADGNPDAYHARFLTDGQFDKRWFPDGSGPATITFTLPAPLPLHRVAWSTDRLQAFQGRFAQPTVSNYLLEGSLDGLVWQKLASGDTRLPPRPEAQQRLFLLAALPPEGQAAFLAAEKQLAAVEADWKKLPALPLAFAGKMEEPSEPVHLLKGGNVMQRGPAVAPASLSFLPAAQLPPFSLPVDAPEGQRRLALAQWLTHPQNPLTPRVIVNRLWHYHFGRGIVGTPSDFGYNGERPTHPELLDHLANRLLASGWSLKAIHREILLSQAYQQSSADNPSAARVDAEARLLWRFPPQRLQAEALRDAMLHVSGLLNAQPGGPSFRLYKYTVDNVATYFPLDKFGPETYRRSVYAESARSIRTELLSVFDCPDSSLPEPRRVVTTSPLQALSLFNHSFTTDVAAAFARRLGGRSLRRQIEQAFLLAFGRPVTPAERARAEQLVRQHGLPALTRALLNANEFVYLH